MSCCLWAGLIRDYYLPRLTGTWENRINGQDTFFIFLQWDSLLYLKEIIPIGKLKVLDGYFLTVTFTTRSEKQQGQKG